jgi:hypothetical protein
MRQEPYRQLGKDAVFFILLAKDTQTKLIDSNQDWTFLKNILLNIRG